MEMCLLPHYGIPGVSLACYSSSMSQWRGMRHPDLFVSFFPIKRLLVGGSS